MKKKFIENEDLETIMSKKKRTPIPSLSNVIMMKEGPPDKTNELLDPEDRATE